MKTKQKMIRVTAEEHELLKMMRGAFVMGNHPWNAVNVAILNSTAKKPNTLLWFAGKNIMNAMEKIEY